MDGCINPDDKIILIKEDYEKLVEKREDSQKKRKAYINQLKMAGADIPKSLMLSPITTLTNGYVSIDA